MNCEPCKTLNCEADDDFGIYNLQDSRADFPSDDPSGTTPCVECFAFTCPNSFEDLTIYNLQSNIVFNKEPITVTVPCPSGWTCDETVVITYPPGTFVLPDPDDQLYIAQGCLSLIVADSAEALFAQLAAQEAQCQTTTNPPETWFPPSGPPPPPPVGEWKNEALSRFISCTPPEELVLTGAPPSWITVDTASGLVSGAAGVFVSEESQADANNRAQVAFDAWIASAQGDGSLACQQPFDNELQTINCPIGNADYYHNYTANIDGNGIYAINGTVYVAANYYHGATQAEANALALAAGQARFDAAVATDQIECCEELSLVSTTSESIGTGCSIVSKTFSSYVCEIAISWGGCGCSGSRYINFPQSICNGNYQVALPECAKGRTIRVTCSVNGDVGCCGDNSVAQGDGTVTSTTASAGISYSLPRETCLSHGVRNISESGDGTWAVPNTPGTKAIAIAFTGNRFGEGTLTYRWEVEIL